MSALATHAHLHEQSQYYLTSLAQVGETAQQMPGWIETGVAQGDGSTQVLTEDGLAGLCHRCAPESLILAERRTGISARVSYRTWLRTLKRCAAYHMP